MELTQMTKPMMDFQKLTFNNAFNTLILFQDQAEKLSRGFVEENPIVPERSKDALKELLDLGKKVRDDYKKNIDEGFKNLESSLTELSKKSS